jgi:putative hydrolase of the HAD superfamily
VAIEPDNGLLIKRIHALTRALAPLPIGAMPRLDPISGIRAVLFDIYGTLVISGSGDIGHTVATTSKDPFQEAWRAAELAPSLLPPDFDGPAALTAQIRGEHARGVAAGINHPEVDIVAIWRALLSDLGTGAREQQLRRLALEYEFRVYPVWPMPGLKALIETLCRRHVVLGVVSNAQFYTPLMLHAFLDQPMDAAGFDPH